MTLKETRSRECLSLAAKGLIFSCTVAAMSLVASGPTIAQSGGAKVVRSDRGGMLGQRAAEIRQLRAAGQRVELRGTCLSACTMYLSLPNVCVDRSATLGFHGPSRNGRNLPQHEFEHWSAVMADNYREPLRSWYLTEARYRTSGYYEIRGSELIQMGYPQC
jgi:hypothetical protein